MFETLESRQMMSISSVTTTSPPPPTTTSSVDVDDSKAESQLFTTLQNAFNQAIKSMGEALTTIARSA